MKLKPQDIILGSRDSFGEMALLNVQPRVASVDSMGFSELLTLNRADFQALLMQDADLKRVIEEVAKERTSGNKT